MRQFAVRLLRENRRRTPPACPKAGRPRFLLVLEVERCRDRSLTMSLIKCTAIIGSQTLVEFEPSIHRIEGAVYAPLGLQDTPWGIYDHGRKFFLPAGTFRGPDVIAPGTVLVMPRSYDTISNVAPDASYVYAGWLHGHYGHFLLSSLSRFWATASFADRNTKILYHGPETAEQLFEKPFFSAIFSALDIGVDRFVSFSEPTIIRSLTIPAPSFEESSFVHRNFASFGSELGQAIMGSTPRRPSERPVYLSKTKVTRGIGRLLNEIDLIDILEREGIDIIHPEQSSLPEQIADLHDRTVVVGLTGSAMHTSIFTPGRSIIGICYTNSILSNYHLLDKANGNDAHYYHPHEDIDREAATAEFQLNYRLKDPRKTAGELLRIVETVVKRRQSLDEQSAGRHEAPQGRRSNLAFGKSARQSSFGPPGWATTPAGRLSAATNGILTGRCQFHTDHEEQPWWIVDLGRAAQLDEIILHNRADDSWDRCSRFSLSTSIDDVEWTVIHSQDSPLSFGNGITGNPFLLSLEQPVRARYVRIILLGINFLHLDQVEVIGIFPPDTGTSDA